MNRFHIRSQSDPSLYWCVNRNQNFALARSGVPPRFLIELRIPVPYLQAVLIGSDDIVISVPVLVGCLRKSVYTDSKGALIISKHPVWFKFKGFTDSFERVASDPDVNGKSPYVYVYKNAENNGEAWELV